MNYIAQNRKSFWKKPKDLEKERRAAYKNENVDLRDVLPKDVRERLDDYSESVRMQLKEQFGMPEIPEDLQNEMGMILDSVAEMIRKNGYSEEIEDEEALQELKQLSVKAIHYKEGVRNIKISAVPEEGFRISYTTKDGEEIERMMDAQEQDMLFNIEMWADSYNQLKNVEAFKDAVKKAREAMPDADEEKKQRKTRQALYAKYAKFGFSHEEINNLIILNEEGDVSEMLPRGVDVGMHRLEIMLDVWKEYLSDKEKSKYVKMAAAIIGVGAAEGITPILFKHMMDAETMQTAALFVGSYIGAETGLGWIRKKLTIGFDKFLNEIMAKEGGGLNERLARDLVFQPGEEMAKSGEHGRLMTAMNRGKSAFRDILSGMTKVTMPAMAGTIAGVGMMMASDWRLGIFSLISAPIAVAIAKKTTKEIEPIVSESYKVEDEITQKIEEQINAHMDIVLNGMRDSFAPRLSELMKQTNKLTTDRAAARATMEYRMGSVLSPAVIGALTAAGVAMRQVGVPVSGNILSATVYAGHFWQSFDNILRQQSQSLESIASIMEMEEVFNGYADEESKQDKKRISASELLNFSIVMRNVSLKIGEKELVKDIDINIPAGAAVRLVGESGHGKTTLMKLIAGYYKPTNGEISIGNTPIGDIKRTGDGSLYEHTAYLSQRPYIFDSENLRENLKFGEHGARDEEMRQVLKELGLEERFLKRGKINLDSNLEGLSGGERARLAAARIILKIGSMKNGGIVFLDEPSEGLDDKNETFLADVLLREKKTHPNVTFILISHSDRFIEKLTADREGEKGLDIKNIKIRKGTISDEPAVKAAI